MYPRLFLRIFKFGRNADVSRRHLIYLVTLKLSLKLCVMVANVVCLKHSLLYCCLVQSTNRGGVSQRDVKYLYCFLRKLMGNFLCFMKSLISNWRGKHTVIVTKPVGLTGTPVYSEDVSFSPDSDSNATLHKSFYHYLCYIILACPGMPCS